MKKVENYTNFFITRTSFWFRTDVINFVQKVSEHPHSIQDRWGDLPVIGVVLKMFGSWDYKENIFDESRYEHLGDSSNSFNSKYVPLMIRRFALFIRILKKYLLMG
jgi:hypothetical protein